MLPTVSATLPAGISSKGGAGGAPGKEQGLEDVTIIVRLNGPYRVRGPITLVDAEGNEFELPGTEFVALCRCGHSKTKPFCDGTHREVGFQAETRAAPKAES